VTFVYFLFLTHLAYGVLATLPFTMEQSGRSYFKFVSASAAFMIAAALGLMFRRYGWDAGPHSPRWPLLAITSVALAATVVYNRAHHFGWRTLRAPCLTIALLAAGSALWFGAPPESRPLVSAVDLSSVLLLGSAAAAMTLGHYYLVIVDLPIRALRTLTVLLIVTLVVRALLVGLLIVGPVHAGYAEAGRVAVGLWSPDGVFVWMRVLFGIAGPFSLIYFIWRTVEIRSTQSATGILYVQLFLVLAGELLAKYLRVAVGLPL
jgi:protein NrfD